MQTLPGLGQMLALFAAGPGAWSGPAHIRRSVCICSEWMIERPAADSGDAQDTCLDLHGHHLHVCQGLLTKAGWFIYNV